MICAVERTRSFCALKSLKVGFIGVCSNVPFWGKSVWLSCLVIFSQVDLKSVVWKTASFYPPVLLDFSIALEAIIMNVFNLLTQLVVPPRGHHRHGQERCPTDGNNIVLHIFLVACSSCDTIAELFYNFMCRRIYLILINNEILRSIIE